MNPDVCRFSLALTPGWTYFLIPVGALVLAVAILLLYRRKSSGSFEWGKVALENLGGVLLFVVGLGMLLAGVGALIAHNNGEFARWVGEKVPILISEADKQVSADLHGKPLGELVSGASATSLYKFDVTPDAAKVPVTGSFEDAKCDADLLLQICGKLASQLTCRTDTPSRILHICTKANALACKA